MRISWMSACVVLFLGASLASAQTTVLPAGDASGSDWPQWAGPNANYTSPEKGLLREWPAGGPEILWRAKIGTGWSCPSVAGNEVYVVPTVWSSRWEDGEKETTVCLDANTGKEIWSYVYDTGKHYQSANINVGWYWGGPRATPTVTEKYVYSIGLLGHMTCLDRKTGKLVWEQDLRPTFWPGPYPEWKGVNFSPIVADGIVVIPFAIGDPRVAGAVRGAGLDAETGKLKWVYLPNMTLPLAKGCDPNGGFLATFDKDRCVVIGGDNGTPYLILRVSDGTLTTHVYKPAPSPNLGWTPVHGPLPVGDYVYAFIVTAGDTGTGLDTWALRMVCANGKTGEVAWKQDGFKMGTSMITADGLLFARSFQSLYLIEATAKGYVEKGKAEKLHDVTNGGGKDGGWVMPVLSRGKLYIRTPSELICYDVKDHKAQ